MSRFKQVGGSDRQIRPVTTLRCEQESFGRKLTLITLTRKASTRDMQVTVPKTDTGRRGEYPQVLEVTLVKELGKLAP